MTVVRGLSDPAHVARRYETEAGRAARKAVYRDVTGPDARELALEAVLRGGPDRVLPQTLDAPVISRRLPVLFVANA